MNAESATIGRKNRAAGLAAARPSSCVAADAAARRWRFTPEFGRSSSPRRFSARRGSSAWLRRVPCPVGPTAGPCFFSCMAAVARHVRWSTSSRCARCFRARRSARFFPRATTDGTSTPRWIRRGAAKRISRRRSHWPGGCGRSAVPASAAPSPGGRWADTARSGLRSGTPTSLAWWPGLLRCSIFRARRICPKARTTPCRWRGSAPIPPSGSASIRCPRPRRCGAGPFSSSRRRRVRSHRERAFSRATPETQDPHEFGPARSAHLRRRAGGGAPVVNFVARSFNPEPAVGPNRQLQPLNS